MAVVSHVINLELPYISFHFFTGNPSDTYLKCLDEVRTISCATLFSPVTRNEAVQAMSELTLSNIESLFLRNYYQYLFLAGPTMDG